MWWRENSFGMTGAFEGVKLSQAIGRPVAAEEELVMTITVGALIKREQNRKLMAAGQK